jgi:site-specific recombinase XerD
VTYQRTSNDRRWHGSDHAPIRVLNRDTGELIRLSHEENHAFWQWAIIETLRLGGLRVEELTELTHLSVRNYQRPNGEVVALLVVSPSKTDRERVIPMSAELFHVIAQVIRRHIREHGTVPIALRYDTHDKIWSPPLPYLFQGLRNSCRRAMSMNTIAQYIRNATDALAATGPEFANTPFAPHDFRRLLATELVNNGLPIHIGAALLGHLSTQTTRGYVAVFDEERHHPLPAIRGTPPSAATRRQILRPHRRRMARFPRALRQTSRRTRLLRTALRHTLPARTRLLNRNDL